MNKTEFIEKIAAETGATKKDTEATVKATLEVITKALSKGDKIALPGFGTFETRKRAAREGRNPQTGKTVKIAACTVPAFKAGKGLKDAVNK